MKRVMAIAACGALLGGCSSLPSWMQFDTPGFLKSTPATNTVQIESEPTGAEARASTGQTCRTPCSLAVPANEFTVSFALPGYQPQTVPVRLTASTEPRDPNNEGDATAPRLVPNPIYVELQPAAPAAAPARKPAPVKKKPRPAPRPAPTAMAPEPAPAAPAPAPASPWPPAPTR